MIVRVLHSSQALVNPETVDVLFYRAVHACPGSKVCCNSLVYPLTQLIVCLWQVLYDVGAKLLPADMLDKLMEVMEDKGIRLHTPLEEIKLLLHS